MSRIHRHRSRVVASVGLAGLLFAVGASGQAPPLGQAASFAVLGGSTVTNTGATAVVGDLGVSPGSSVTGFPPGVVTGGTIHSNDAVAAQAQSDLTIAYNDLAGRPFDTSLTGQDLGGLTLIPAVYNFASSAQLTGTLQLDAQGNPNAVFIFQIGSSLTTASNSSVLVINGGSNCNVFWQVGSTATLGTQTSFAGNILALTSITLNTGAGVSGRALAQTGAVTLDTNSVAVCGAPCPPITLGPSSLPNGTIGIAYSQTITATGGTAPYTFSVIAGALPGGLTLSSAGLLSGIPTATGSFTFTVQATDATGCPGSAVYTIIVNAFVCPTIFLAPTSLAAPAIGVPYTQTITASGGTPPYGFAVTSGSLPPGLTLSPAGPSSAVLSGTPTANGSFLFTITATDASGCLGSRAYSLRLGSATLPIPTLSAWALIVLTGLLAVAGYVTSRR